MFKNIKINFKKIACAGLSALMLFATGCGKEIPDFDYAAEDLSSYVTLGDFNSYTRDMVEAEYKKVMEEEESADSYIVEGGSSLDFYVTTYVKNGDDFEKYEKLCYETYGSPVGSYRVLKDAANADFDKCLMANISSTAETAAEPRTITNGKAFSFTIDIDAECANADIAGKTLRFVIVPENYVAPLYDDAEVNVYTREYFNALSTKQEIEVGDAVFFSVVATTGGAAIYTNTNAFFFVGDNSLFPGFDEWLIGKKAGSYNFSLTFGENAFTDDSDLYLASGQKVDFYVNITKICAFAEEDFSTAWELKEHCRLSMFAKAYLYEKVIEDSKVNSYPEAAYALMDAQVRSQVDDMLEYYREYLGERLGNVTEEYVFNFMQKEVLGEETFKNAEELITDVAKAQMDYIVLNNALADALGIEYSYDEYKADMQKMLESYGDFESTIEEVENGILGGKHYYYASFLAEKIADKLAEPIMK